MEQIIIIQMRGGGLMGEMEEKQMEIKEEFTKGPLRKTV